jgi:hypothetical protein
MIYSGEVNVATAGTRVQLSSSRVPCSWVLVQSKRTNTQYVHVGGVNVDSSNGTELVPFDSVLFPPLGDTTPYDLAHIWVDADVNGEGVKFTYFRL